MYYLTSGNSYDKITCLDAETFNRPEASDVTTKETATRDSVNSGTHGVANGSRPGRR
jgi:hypothetical protein